MKELTIQEKAKAYDEALERAKTIQEKSNGMILKKWLWGVFPELRESEDGRIRKCICLCLEECVHNDIIRDYEKDKCLAWLEKQLTPQVRTGLEWVNTIDDACDKRYAEEYAHGEYCHEQSFKWGFQEGVDWLEKQGEKSTDEMKELLRTEYEKGRADAIAEMQGEHKPDDKVEPKFHEGEWITNGDYTWQIVKIKPLDYILQSQDGNIVDDTISHVDEQFHSFTMEDAKDGDVLATENFIFIFKNIDNGNGIHYYCQYEISKHEDDNQFDVALPQSLMGRVGNSISHYSPATKEQRDTLMKAMKDARYTFDFEKKKLKKIEENELGIPFGAKDSELQEVTYYIPKGFHAEIDWNKVVIKKGNQKPAWSKEDEEMLASIISDFAAAHKSSIGQDKWLKSLKERIKGE